MKGHKPFYVAIADEVIGIEIFASVRIAASVLLALAKLAESCTISSNHDAIAEAFRQKMETISKCGFPDITERLKPLFNHIAAEKERCALEIAKHLRERDGKKEGKRRSSFDADKLIRS